MKQSLNLKLQNRLNLTLSLKTQINILTLSKTELLEEIKEELQENPFLEEIYNIQPQYTERIQDLSVSYEEEEELNPLARIPHRQSLQDIIENQINIEFEGEDKDIALEIVDNIDEKGFFKGDLESIAGKFKREIKYIERIRKKITQLEPIGIASKDLEEFLLIQLDELDIFDPVIESMIIEDLKNLNDITFLSEKYKLSKEEIEEKIDVIKHLKPYPLYGYEDIDIHYVEPDIFIYIKPEGKEGDFFDVVINDFDIPKVNFINSYKRILSKKDIAPEVREFLNQKYEKALGIIKGLQQRKENLYSLVKMLAEYQKDFLLNGKDYIKPLTLKEVSEKIGLHESTISRIVSNKYAVTPQGVLPLKAFFASKASKESGNISSESVKYLIKNLIENEDPKKPLSDLDIVDMLKKEGIKIARRTVTKYREDMGIPDSRKRKLK
ncbi:MAG: RNA polymerase factor sigma-54 [Hydrogenothermaceae bacterium]|nr:RNA polymerase factor sigma-54 [Hydrogenothermaceae bacterium]